MKKKTNKGFWLIILIAIMAGAIVSAQIMYVSDVFSAV